MIKIFPIIIIPSIFIIIFFNVKNLTQKNQHNPVVIDKKINVNKNISETIENTLIEEKEKNSVKLESVDPEAQQKDLFLEDGAQKKLTKNPEGQDSYLKSSSEEKKSNLKEQDDLSKNEKKFNQNDENSTQTRPTMIQFGAFSKLKNAEKHKNFLNEKLSKEFSDFDTKLKIKEDNNLFKILYSSGSSEIAKKICKFSKSRKIGCLILKK